MNLRPACYFALTALALPVLGYAAAGHFLPVALWLAGVSLAVTKWRAV
jgi:hypothetical protein